MEIQNNNTQPWPISELKGSNTVITEGKTKIVKQHPEDKNLAIVESKDDITGGDGVRHDVIRGKAELATDTTCNVFRLLKACGVPNAFEKQLDATTFVAKKCNMIPYEVIVRREAHGSFIKRNPHLHKGQHFPKLLLEFFLKTANKEWQGTPIPKDDPFIQFDGDKAKLYRPDMPTYAQEPFMTLENYPLRDKQELFEQMDAMAKKTFLILEKAWQSVGRTLVDFKVEFGFDSQDNLLLADVIDNDSWRVLENGYYIDKQVYREGGELNKVTRLYKHVRDLTSRFSIPQQQLIIWRASEKDNVEPFMQALEPFMHDNLKVSTVTISMHKDPVKGYQKLNELVQEIPNSVVLALVGRSNGAGPTLSATTSAPVITVPAGWDKFPEDVWSSLRTPSDTPVMTVLDQKNALLAALQILGMNNPVLYAQLHIKQEPRLMNFVQV